MTSDNDNDSLSSLKFEKKDQPFHHSSLEIIESLEEKKLVHFNKHLSHRSPNKLHTSKTRWLILFLLCVNSVNLT